MLPMEFESTTIQGQLNYKKEMLKRRKVKDVNSRCIRGLDLIEFELIR